MATSNKVFIPVSWTPDKVTVSASSQSAALTGETRSEDSVRIFNGASETVFVTFSAGSGTATTNDTPIGSGQAEAFGIAADVTHVNVIGTGATGIIYFSVGKGV